jgi:hypothetical protein
VATSIDFHDASLQSTAPPRRSGELLAALGRFYGPLRRPEGYHGRRFENLVELQNRRVRVGLRRKYDIGGFFVLIEVADSIIGLSALTMATTLILLLLNWLDVPRESSSASILKFQ